jgi:CheY-like chemotaxis protein
MLEDLGHEVVSAGCVAHALEILRNGQHVDLLITDYSMPRMNGVELAKAVSKLRPGTPILLATGYAELPTGSGVDLPRIGKPYQQDQLAADSTKVLGSEDKRLCDGVRAGGNQAYGVGLDRTSVRPALACRDPGP